MRAMLLSAIMVLALATAAPAQANDQKICFNLGVAPDAALAACTRLIQSRKLRGQVLANAYYARGFAYSKKQEHQAAIAEASEAIRQIPAYGAAYRLRGFSYANVRDFPRALADLNHSIRLEPRVADAFNSRGLTYGLMRDFDKALVDFNQAIRLNPKQGDYYGNRAIVYHEQGHYQKAIAEYRLAIARGHKPSVENLKQSQAALAQAAAARAVPTVQPVPASPPPAIAAPVIPQVPAEEQAICSNRASAPNSVISACSTVIASGALSGRTLAITYHQRALAYRQINDSDRAIADATESIRLDPSQAGYFLTRCLAHYSKQNYGPAIADASDAIRLDPKSVSAYVNRAALHALTDDYDRALADTDEALRLDASNAGAQNVRGYVFNRKGMFDRALAELHEVIRRSPTFAVAYKNRAISHEGRGELDLALSDFRKAIELGLRGSPAAEAEATEGIRRVERKLAESHPPAAETKVAADAPQTVTPPAAERSESNATATAVAPAQRRVALVLGNGKYRHSTPLNNPANDAGDIASALRKIGFEVVEGIDVDRRSMEDKVREFGRKLDGAKLALFYYAGHGLQVGGKNYLLPVDSKLERAGDLPFETIDVHQVLAQMETEQRVNLVFLDACRDNPLSRSLRRSLGARSSSVGTGLATIQSAIGTMISFATQPDAIALDGEGRNSPFTTGILKHLSTPGLDIAILMRRVRADVIADTGGKQVPWDHSSLIGEVVLAR